MKLSQTNSAGWCCSRKTDSDVIFPKDFNCSTFSGVVLFYLQQTQFHKNVSWQHKIFFPWPNPWVRAYFVAVFSISWWHEGFHDFLFCLSCVFAGTYLCVGFIGEWGLNREMFYVTFRRKGCCWFKEQSCLYNSLLNLTEYFLALLKNVILLYISPFTTAF